MQILSMIQFFLIIRRVQNLLCMLVVIFTLVLLLYFFLLFRPNRLKPFLYRLNILILVGFKRNIIFMFTSGSDKMLKTLIEIIVQVFHDSNFSA